MAFDSRFVIPSIGRNFVYAAVATLTACSSGGLQESASQAFPNVPQTASQGAFVDVRSSSLLRPENVSGPARSWIAPDVKKAQLLYAAESSSPGFVNIYDQNGHDQAPIGQLTGLQYPVGLYVDKAGNLYVANSNAFDVPIYKRGATSPFKTLNDPGEYPYGVATDTKGTVYVASAITTSHTAGNVAVYANGSVNPTSFLSDPQWFSAVDVTTDSYDNVYVCFNEAANTNQFGVDEFLAGTTKPIDLGLNIAHYCDGIVKDGHHNLVVADPGAKTIDVFPANSKTPSRTFATAAGAVGISFGSTFTNVYAAGSSEVDEYAYASGALVNTITKGFTNTGNGVLGVAAEPRASK